MEDFCTTPVNMCSWRTFFFFFLELRTIDSLYDCQLKFEKKIPTSFGLLFHIQHSCHHFSILSLLSYYFFTFSLLSLLLLLLHNFSQPHIVNFTTCTTFVTFHYYCYTFSLRLLKSLLGVLGFPGFKHDDSRSFTIKISFIERFKPESR